MSLNNLKFYIGLEYQIIDIGIFVFTNKILSNFIRTQLIADVPIFDFLLCNDCTYFTRSI